MGRIVRTGVLVLALVASLLAVSASPAAAAPGSVTVTVSSVLPDDSLDIYGFYDLALVPVGGGDGGAAFRGATPGDPATLTGWNGTEFTPDVEPGAYTLNVGVGGPGTNPGLLASRPVTVPDGGDVDVALTVDDRLACVSGTVRAADGSDLPAFGLQVGLPGGAWNPGLFPAPGGSTVDYDWGCGIAGTFLVTASDLDTWEPIASRGASVAAGESVVVDLVIGEVAPNPVAVSGNPSARSYPTADGTSLVTVGTGSTEPLTVTFDAECPGGAMATSVVVHHGGTTYDAAHDHGAGDWSATIPRAGLTSGDLSATVTCPGGDGSALDLGSIVLYDPSGVITDAVTHDVVEGATVSLFRVPDWAPRTDAGDTGPDTCESHLSKDVGSPWSQAAPTGEGVPAPEGQGMISPEVNVQTTGADGRYGWDVAYGCWYVTVEADGYEPLTSPVVGVPPEVTDLDLELTPLDTPVVPCTTPPFPDVPTTSQFCADIEWLEAEGIAGGYPDGQFKPTNAVSRQAMAAFLHRYTGQPEPTGPCDTTGGFPDVPTGHSFCHEIMWMVGEGLSNGYPDGTFKPTNPISRQAMAAFLFRLAGRTETGPCPGTGFPDVPVGHGFCHEVAWMVDGALTGGYPDGTFKPTNPISRQAAAAFLHRYDALPAD